MVLGLSVVSVNTEMGSLITCLNESPLSGEIDIVEARGNSPAYPAQYAELPSAFHYFRSAIFDRDCLVPGVSTTLEDR